MRLLSMEWLHSPSEICLFTFQLLLSYFFFDLFISFLWALFFLSHWQHVNFYLWLRPNICLNSSLVSLARGGNHYSFNVWSMSLNNIPFFSIMYVYIDLVVIPFFIAYLQMGTYLYGIVICWKKYSEEEYRMSWDSLSSFKIGICFLEKFQDFFFYILSVSLLSFWH